MVVIKMKIKNCLKR